MIQISVSQKGLRADTVKRLVTEALSKKCPDAKVFITRKEPAESRADRFAEIQEMLVDCRTQAEELRGELQDWRDDMPENLQDGSKAAELDSAIDELNSFIDSCEEAEGISVDFPGMF